MGKSYYIFLLIYCLCACQTSRKGGTDFSGEELFLKKTDLVIKDTSLLGKYEMIPLELNKHSGIKWIDKILLFEDKVGVVDLGLRAFFVFDRQGNFLYEINHVGDGPGEYTQLLDVCLDPVDSCFVFLTSPYNILVYSYADEFKYSIKLEEAGHKIAAQRIAVQGDYIYLLVPDRAGYDRQEYSMMALNRRNGKKTYLLEQGIRPVESLWTHGYSLVPGRDAVYYMQRYTHRIYKVKGEKCTPFYELNLGKFELPDHMLQEGLDKPRFMNELSDRWSVFCLTNFCELPGGFMLSSNLPGLFYYDYQKEELDHFDGILNEDYGIELYSSTPVEPVGENVAFVLNNLMLANMKEHRRENETPALKALLDRLPDDPNPVLFLYSQKK